MMLSLAVLNSWMQTKLREFLQVWRWFSIVCIAANAPSGRRMGDPGWSCRERRDISHTVVLLFQFCVCQGLDILRIHELDILGVVAYLYYIELMCVYFSSFQAQSEAYTGSQWPTLILKVIFFFIVFPKL